jgi:hypothetical protein
MALGVGSYGSMSAERSVNVSVVPSESAYLGVTDELRCGTSGTDLIRNQFGPNVTIEHIEIEVTAVDGYVRVGADGPATRLAPGESVDLSFRGPYAAGDTAELRVEPPTGNVSGADDLRIELVEARGTGVSVSGVVRSYDVNCPSGA